MDQDLRVRKSPRLPQFDYSASRYYFITICTSEHRCLFGKIASTKYNGRMILNHRGEVLRRHIEMLDSRYPSVRVMNHVIMPNHIHMILLLDNDNTVAVPQVIGLFKSGVSRELSMRFWQRSYFDRVIRNEREFKIIWNYIDNNPAEWATDRYHVPGV